jgi:short-subunit dehydrogenase
MNDKVAVVTGASSGIGRALADELTRAGHRLGLLARRRELLDEIAGNIRGKGGVVEVAVADVADRDQVLSAVGELQNRLGPIDLMVANAGVGTATKWDPPNVVEQVKMIEVNLFGVMYAIESVLPDMLRRGSGHIAAISSIAAYKGIPGSAGYCASKSAVNAYMESVRIQLHGRGVAFTTVCPGFIRTPMIEHNKDKLMFEMSAEKAARLIVRAIGRKAKVYDFPWPTALLMRLTWLMPDRMIWRRVRGGLT